MISSVRSRCYPPRRRAMHSAMMSRWQRRPPWPSTGYTGHWRAEDTPPVASSATHLPHSPQPSPESSARKASPCSARHHHAVDRAGVVDAGRSRQPRESSHARKLAHVAACHGQPRPSRLGGGGDASPAKAEVRGGGHECGRSAANARPAVCRRHGGRCAVRRSGRDERVVAPQAGGRGQHDRVMRVRESSVRGSANAVNFGS